MIGFDGDATRSTALWKALEGVLDAFPEHLAKPINPTWFDPDEVERNKRFDAIVRAHKHKRLRIPIAALLCEGAPYHGFDLMHLRRLAWFVPSLLAAWLEAAPKSPLGRFLASDVGRIFSDVDVEGDAWTWTESEAAALASFCDAALLAALATPLRPPPAGTETIEHAPGVALLEALLERQLREQGRALETIELAAALRVPIRPLVTRWMDDPRPDTLDHLVAPFRSIRADEAARLLAYDAVDDRLARAFLDASGACAEEIARAEALIHEQLVFKRS